ncbi:MAG: hypothetical protein JRI23_19945 [Deltaproteobacteria bacterium]|jgi:hypothetical protein|nr:hypothetical protein [Deltaproteobacteria bacterium]MBW2534145.1 hypothetical protein [Deltaproteobacteria bacterium]
MHLTLRSLTDGAIDQFATLIAPLSNRVVKNISDEERKARVRALIPILDEKKYSSWLKFLRREAEADDYEGMRSALHMAMFIIPSQFVHLNKLGELELRTRTHFGILGWMLHSATGGPNLVPSYSQATRVAFDGTTSYDFSWMLAEQVRRLSTDANPRAFRAPAIESVLESPSYPNWSRPRVEELVDSWVGQCGQVLAFVAEAQAAQLGIVAEESNPDWSYD